MSQGRDRETRARKQTATNPAGSERRSTAGQSQVLYEQLVPNQRAEAAPARAFLSRVPGRGTPLAHSIESLQRTAGNQTTTALIAQLRHEDAAGIPPLAQQPKREKELPVSPGLRATDARLGNLQRKGGKASLFSKLFKRKKKQKPGQEGPKPGQERPKPDREGPTREELYHREVQAKIDATRARLKSVIDGDRAAQLDAVGLKKAGRKRQDWAGEHVSRALIADFSQAGGIAAILESGAVDSSYRNGQPQKKNCGSLLDLGL